MKLFITQILCFISISVLTAQINPGARQIAIASSDAGQADDVFAVFNNPAGLAQMDWREIGLYYSPAPFGMSELANGFAAYQEPTAIGVFAAGFMTYGFELYRENKFALAYSIRILDKFFAGMTVFYQTLSIKNYGSTGTYYLIVGGLAYFNKEIRFGFSVENPTRSTYGHEQNQIPVVFNCGLSYDILTDLTINIAGQKELDFNPSLRFGTEYNLIKYLTLRTGFSNEPGTFSAGIGINYSFLQLDYAVFTHQDLGLTHQAGLIIQFGSDEPRAQKIRNNLFPNN